MNGTGTLAQILPALGAQLPGLKDFINQVNAVIAPLQSTLQVLLPQVSEITQFTDDLSKSFTDGDPNNSFFIPAQAFENPLFKSAMPYFFSGDGKVTREQLSIPVDRVFQATSVSVC
ncbi:Putative membrane protein MmpL [Mycobacteroides abscessus]|nr:Putative membrane protein MmpL [Mycobacteroides abscessus]